MTDHPLPNTIRHTVLLDVGFGDHQVTQFQADVEALWAAVEADPTTPVTVDLQAKQVTYGSTTVPFEIDDYTRWRLLEGLDDVGLTERQLPDI